MQMSGNIFTFRQCVIADVRHRLDFSTAVRPSRPVIPYFRARRAALQVYSSGDWRKSKRVEYYFQTPWDDSVDRANLGHKIRTLVHLENSQYRRDRWIGLVATLDQLGLLEACNGISRRAFRRCCASCVPPPHNTAPLVGAPEAAEAEVKEDQSDDEEAELEWLMRLSHVRRDWAEQNARHQRLAKDFVVARPLARTMILRAVYEPLRVILNRLIRVSSQFGEEQQAAREARHLMGKSNVERRIWVKCCCGP